MAEKHPNDDQIQIIVFGSGYGESILLHLGNRNWVIIDSCTNKSGKPIATLYLRKIGVNVESEVKLVVATHWHEDHIKGLNEILRECKAAEFAMPGILDRKEFQTYLKRNIVNFETQGRNNSILKNCLEIIKERKLSPIHILEGTSLTYFLKLKFIPQDWNVEIISLSPTNEQFTNFLTEIGSNDHIPATTRNDSSRKNELSAAIFVKINGFGILLGADVIITDDCDSGWEHIINCQKSESTKSTIYKVAHHGSESSDHDEIWNQLLVDSPISIITPWIHGGKRLPKDEDIDRFAKRPGDTYLTSKKIEHHYLIEEGEMQNKFSEIDELESLEYETGFVKVTIENNVDVNVKKHNSKLLKKNK